MYLFYGMDKVVISVSIVLQLTFFSTLKQMRIINEKLVNEISKGPNDADVSYKCWIFCVCVCVFVSLLMIVYSQPGAYRCSLWHRCALSFLREVTLCRHCYFICISSCVLMFLDDAEK